VFGDEYSDLHEESMTSLAIGCDKNDYSTLFFQMRRPVHIVSIFSPPFPQLITKNNRYVSGLLRRTVKTVDGTRTGWHCQYPL